MIDIENEIFTEIRNTVKEQYPKATVSGTLNNQPARFPFVYVAETDNYPYKNSADSGSIENHAVVVYTIDVYSADKTDKKAQAKAITQLIDSYFTMKGFRRKSNAFLYSNDNEIYRMITRYEAIVSTDYKIYRR